MIDYNRKLSNERETHRMSTLVLLETLIFIKIVSISVMLFYVQYCRIFLPLISKGVAYANFISNLLSIVFAKIRE